MVSEQLSVKLSYKLNGNKLVVKNEDSFKLWVGAKLVGSGSYWGESATIEAGKEKTIVLGAGLLSDGKGKWRFMAQFSPAPREVREYLASCQLDPRILAFVNSVCPDKEASSYFGDYF